MPKSKGKNNTLLAKKIPSHSCPTLTCQSCVSGKFPCFTASFHSSASLLLFRARASLLPFCSQDSEASELGSPAPAFSFILPMPREQPNR